MSLIRHWRVEPPLMVFLAWCAIDGPLSPISVALDWPTYQADATRSGVTEESIEPPLVKGWTFRSKHAPKPAWPAEAKWDGWNKVYRLKNRQTFDFAFQVVASEGKVYFGSSADDKIDCLDAATGSELWSFYTEGPVRFAPAVHGSRLFFGSDDGNIYCLDKATGALVWRRRPAPADRRIPGNGRMISAWPSRTGVIVRDGIAYAGVGMFPSEGVYLCALDAATGEIRWRARQTDLPAQGYLLASATRLYVPTGRSNPVVMDIRNGKRLQVLNGQGGAYALLTDESLVFGPGKTGQLGVVDYGTKDQVATFTGNHMIVHQGRSYLHSDTALQALDRTRYLRLAREQRDAVARQREVNERLKKIRKNGSAKAQDVRGLRAELVRLARHIDQLSQQMGDCLLWSQRCDFPLSLILAGKVLYAGGDKKIGAFEAGSGRLIWQSTVQGRAFGLAASDGRIFASTDLGTIHCFVARKP